MEREAKAYRKKREYNQTVGRSARNSCSHAESHEQKGDKCRAISLDLALSLSLYLYVCAIAVALVL